MSFFIKMLALYFCRLVIKHLSHDIGFRQSHFSLTRRQSRASMISLSMRPPV